MLLDATDCGAPSRLSWSCAWPFRMYSGMWKGGEGYGRVVVVVSAGPQPAVCDDERLAELPFLRDRHIRRGAANQSGVPDHNFRARRSLATTRSTRQRRLC